MANVWLAYEGREPTRGHPLAHLPLSEAISLFELEPEDYRSDLAATLRFGNVDQDLWYLGYKHVVIEIGKSEARAIKWKPGFYHSNVKPEEAVGRLIKQPLVAELGAENVVRVEYEPTTDSRGQDALKITIIIAPGATKKLAKEASLNALVRLQERLNEMRENRTPIIEYATEVELAQDGGP